jgi:hypothetical protein
MSKDQEHKGWTNYATHAFWRAISANANTRAYWDKVAADVDTQTLAVLLRSSGLALAPTMPVGLWEDLIDHSLQQVNWLELARELQWERHIISEDNEPQTISEQEETQK